MTFTLLVGNNFISNSPRNVRYNQKTLFKLEQISDSHNPSISANIADPNNKIIIQVVENVCKYCSPDLIMKKSDLGHVLIVDKTGEIVFESRILDKKTILVSGIFYVDDLKLTITQNYIILPTQKWIMHDKVDANNKNINITNEGIRVSS
ncbi:MAG: hypothetical protein L0H55_01145 [Candidatus Nitrosocosmicus sp.]|nr:hypothetical protein [Candidatus Nitrosocosmicus sp.]